MITNYKYSKRLHLATICCFLLPFFYGGCGSGPEEKAAAEKAKTDSLEAIEAVKTAETLHDSVIGTFPDTITQNNISKKDTPDKQVLIQESDTKQKTEDNSKTVSQKVVNNFPFLRSFLIPREYTYTGIASVIDVSGFIVWISIFVSFLLLIIGLIVKFIETGALKTIILLDILALGFLIISESMSWDCEKLWGFWLCVVLASLLTIYDIYIIILKRKNLPKSF
jgi:hypothetical protein